MPIARIVPSSVWLQGTTTIEEILRLVELDDESSKIIYEKNTTTQPTTNPPQTQSNDFEMLDI